MADPAPAPASPIFNFNAYSPAEIQEAIEQVGVKKANMPFLPSFMLAAVAGGSIGLGALYYTIVASDAYASLADWYSPSVWQSSWSAARSCSPAII